MTARRFARYVPYPIKQGLKYVYGAVPLRVRCGKVFRDTYDFLQESQWWSRRELEEYQMRQLSRLMHHVYDNVPYYRRLLDDRGLKPASFCGVEDLKRLPLLTTDVIEKHKEEFISRAHRANRLAPAHTGGTTGSPLHFWHERRVTGPKERAFFRRMHDWHGYHTRDKAVMLTGSFQPGEKIWYDPLTRCLRLFNPVMTVAKASDYVRLIEDFKPNVLRGYPSLIYPIAHLMNRHGMRLKRHSISGVFCASEKMYAFQRAEIGEAFRCKVVDHYGHHEMLVLMQRCELNKEYHSILEYGITEIIGDDGEEVCGAGKMGEIVGTGFNNYAFPMIRYKTGDWAAVSDGTCACGRAFPLVTDVVGRSGDFILTPSGTLVSPTTIEFAIRYMKHFRDVQLVQVDLDRIDIHIVPDESYIDEEGSQFAEGVRERVGDGVKVTPVIVEEIERPLSQKKQFIKSEISRRHMHINT
jgi:phenylacetate-CoA ligase